MKKVTLFKLSAIALALGVAGVANAGTISGGVTVDSETAPTAATSIVLTGIGSAVKYQVSGLPASGQAITENSTVIAYIKLTGATFGSTAPADFSLAGFPNVTGPSAVTGVVLNTAKDTAAVSIRIGAATGTATVIIPNTAVVSWVGTMDVANVRAASVTAQGYLDLVGAAPTGAFVVPAVTADATAAPVVVFNTAPAIAAAVAASGDTARIDLGTTPVVGSAFTSTGTMSGVTTLANIAKLTLTNAATLPTLYNATPVKATLASLGANGSATQTVAVSPAVGSSFTPGMVFSVSPNANCTTPVTATTTLAPVSANVTAATTSVSLVIANADIPAAAPTSNITAGDVSTSYLCVTAPVTATAMTPATFNVTNTLNTTAPDTATAAGTALAYNGQVRTLSTYVPAAVVGYTTLVRVINNGTVAAPVSVSVTDEAGVTTTGATPIVTLLKAGATVNLSSALIEANVVAPTAFTAASRPRVTISAPTNAMVIQNFVVTPAGALTELSSQAAQ